MSKHVPSNMATYQKSNGEPVYNTFFVMSEVSGSFHLFAFESEAQRAAAIECQTSKGKTAVALSHIKAFEHARAGMSAWLFEGGNNDVATYTPLEIAAGFKGGWKPRVIKGGIPVVALE